MRAKLEAALDTPDAHPEPRPVKSYADQAEEFLKLVAPMASSPAKGKAKPKAPAKPKALAKTKPKAKPKAKAAG